MLHRRLLLALAATIFAASALAGDGRVKAVASFSILGDLVREVGGDRVEVATLVGANGDVHVYEPTPADARKLGEADILFENGLDFEGWLPRLIAASGFGGVRVVASAGVTPRGYGAHDDHDHHGHADHHHGPADPHAWQNVENVVIYVRNIAAALEKVDPDHAEAYRARAAAYTAKLEALDATLKERFAAIPAARRKVVISHDAFGYFGDAYGVTFVDPRGASTGGDASAADVARIIDQIRSEGISAVFVENIASPKLTDQIAVSTGAKIGGRLYSDALTTPDEPASTYLGLIESNARQIISALTGAP
ncbi:MAG: metal ABC transporter solute-binding protein, Zn/Mn family [Pseudochelatococcus sp.]|uniref:metal ABC transporter solute-binding protein, Zn/Mn family n=1 Tax=Pseudochelatococcus sp. TaxID=2020869 RepID=UPI003D8C9C3C